MRKYSTALVVSLWVMVLAIAGTAFVLKSYRASLQTEFNDAAALRVAALQRSLDEKLLVLQSMHSLYAIFDGKPQPQFRRFVQPFEDRLDGVQALQWVIPVTAEARDEFERNLQDSGIAGYEIKERNAAGLMVRAADRALYFPVYPLLPLDEGEASIGFDLASTPVRKAAIDEAIRTGALTVSGRIALLQGNSPDAYGFAVFDPLFAATPAEPRSITNLRGLVLGVFRLSSIVDAVQAEFSPASIHMEIFDRDAPLDESLLYGPMSAAAAAQSLLDHWFMPAATNYSMQVGNRLWDVRVHVMPEYLQGRQPVAAWLLLGGGVFLSALLSLYLGMRTRHEAHLRAIDEQRQLLENQLFHAQRLDAIGQMVGGVAHDFKNLLTSILGNSDLLRLQLSSNRTTLQHYLDQIEQAATRGNGLIHKLLSFSRKERAVPQSQALAPLAESTVAMLRPIIPANIAFDVAIAEGLPLVTIDTTSFDQILVNLCINARDAIAGEGRIGIGLQQQLMTGEHCAACGASVNGPFVVLTLEDTGSGMDDDTLGQVFDPFFTTKTAGKGTGLGLTIINSIVHEHAGHVLLDSAPSSGTRFRVVFPIAH